MKMSLAITSTVIILFCIIYLGEYHYSNDVDINLDDSIRIVQGDGGPSIKSSHMTPVRAGILPSTDETALNMAFSAQFNSLRIAKTTCLATECTIEIAPVSSRDNGANDDLLRMLGTRKEMLLRGSGFVVYDQDFLFFANDEASVSLKVRKPNL